MTTDNDLPQQTLDHVRIAGDVDAAARARLAQKRGERFSTMHRETGADGITRWYDEAGHVVAKARNSSEDCERCRIARVNVELARRLRAPRRDWSWRWPLLLAAALLATAALVLLAH